MTVVVEDALLAAIGQAISPPPPYDGGRSEVPRQLLEAVVNYLVDGMSGCNHFCGICECAEWELVADIRAVLGASEVSEAAG